VVFTAAENPERVDCKASKENRDYREFCGSAAEEHDAGRDDGRTPFKTGAERYQLHEQQWQPREATQALAIFLLRGVSSNVEEQLIDFPTYQTINALSRQDNRGYQC